ncbi:pyruvate dehydrogenase (acetyl-transferring) E1 component subunit alpha [Georgenia sp. 10Sc9-8]|uniref:Pyruvate dehydrogenase (Acetyl-transferring) E1 component subunit alpha n=1 Tax=Georgenia halotolerans TaxID=3028317 RepID=A0ABT5U0C8_9MICO|nr:pyruvate dehydrogenase (acetyl-transferring) E1 component subunit alpha [Georgenia halotolerans]
MDQPTTAQAGHESDPDALVQLLGPDGRRHDHPLYGPLLAELTGEEMRTMYRDMVLTRAFDAEATSLQRKGELGLWPPSLGQEAAQVGSAHAYVPRDVVFPSYREHGVALARGVDPNALLPVFRGTRHGGWDPRAHNVHLYSFVIGSQALHAVGYAMGVQRDGDVGTGDPQRDRAVSVYFGDGATSQGDVSEALVFAASAGAPVVFQCQNNQWAISVPASTQSRTPLARRAEGFGVPAVRVDGNDVLASYAVTAHALRRARAGEGPVFVEAYTYRLGAHTTSDDPTRYRSRAEEESWRAKDPIARMRTYLEQEGLVDDAFLDEVEDAARACAESARASCHDLTPEPLPTVLDHVYSAPHPLVDAERAEAQAYVDSFAEVDR